ncbi:HAD-IA family hydrolase [Cetobacterium somerae]|uniref:HAD family hydrolase n=1 Tax=Cetobacterium sp. NK01 TaxID=2993530 RepID=UPI002116DA86|nr:HAD-IA family hydrolase [Cetobacterium sp. NK01]MCQ8212937.1 HAD-IA family hydrolase [Cetobacterium sp. NK01]
MKNIVFDIGNVLLDFHPQDFLKGLGLEKNIEERLYKLIFLSEEWKELDRGSIDYQVAEKIFKTKAPELKNEISLVLEKWHEMLTPIEGNVNLLKSLKDYGYNIYYLSNFQKDVYEKMYNKYDFLRIGNGGVISYQVNTLKPDHSMYTILLSKYNLDPSETLFIDDSFDNIEEAKKIGFHSVLFTDCDELKNTIKPLL